MPAVTLVILFDPLVVVDNVSPPPGFDIVYELGYLRITMPEPPDPLNTVPTPPSLAPPPPPPVVSIVQTIPHFAVCQSQPLCC